MNPRQLLLTAALTLGLLSQAHAIGTCAADVINIGTDVNWNNAFPITIGGVKVSQAGQGPTPLMMYEPPVCICPDRDPLHMIGIGMTYWSPEFMAEVQSKAGCLSSMGGAQVAIPPVMGVAPTDSNGPDESSKNGNNRRMQLHWIKYPLFAMIDVFNTLACENTSGDFAVAGLSEVDPFWHDAFWADVVYPETFLFANPIANLACIPDAVASTIRLPLDMLTWCLGSQGSLYPITGMDNEDNTKGMAAANVQILGKWMYQLSRHALLQSSIGPWAQCHAQFLPLLVKSQYRLDLMKPIPSTANIRFGRLESLWNKLPPTNPGRRYDSTFMIWQGQQCCAF